MDQPTDASQLVDAGRPRPTFGRPKAGRTIDPRARRSRRVVLLLILLCLLNAFDLACTVTVHKLGAFQEANPVARYVLQYPSLVVLFKVSLVGFSSLVLFAYRRRRIVEIACWCVCAVYVALAFIWLQHLQETAQVASFLRAPS